jgi:glycerate-2-kinase
MDTIEQHDLAGAIRKVHRERMRNGGTHIVPDDVDPPMTEALHQFVDVGCHGLLVVTGGGFVGAAHSSVVHRDHPIPQCEGERASQRHFGHRVRIQAKTDRRERRARPRAGPRPCLTRRTTNTRDADPQR